MGKELQFGGVIINGSVEHAVALEKAGFDTIWVYDHLQHWSDRDGVRNPELCPMSLVILPLVLDKVRCPVGTSVLCPLFRYHPAVIAQYFAQLDYLFPNRILLGVGTGEAMCEAPLLGGEFPPYKERAARLVEAVDIMRRLWSSDEYVEYKGQYYEITTLKLFLKPKGKIPIIISAIGRQSAKIAGEIGDGLMTMSPVEKVRNEILPEFERAARAAGKKPEEMPKIAWVLGGVVEFSERILKAMRRAAPWANEKVFSEMDPRKIDKLAEEISKEDLLRVNLLTESVDELIGRIEEYVRAGMNHIAFYDVTNIVRGKPLEVPAMWRERILPYFKEL
ncbi:MAG TPA: LLM class flavin-dependent oxidoreductase [Methanomicrobia archaeon]|nr:LLM class flavin-dependent oxidoreductase [Methanomicrobia archaeon]HEX59384.1 LLM class flavin-dependent oxidoreductase [Methanomicrobia archaeon]